MRRYLPALLLALTAFAPFPLAGCDKLAKLKGSLGGGSSDEDAAVEATAEPVANPDAVNEPPPEPTPDTPAEPLPDTPAETPTTTAAVPTTLPTTTLVDAGAKTVIQDAAAPAPVTDSGAAPAPTPTLQLPSNFLDGGLLRLPRLDGGLKRSW